MSDEVEDEKAYDRGRRDQRLDDLESWRDETKPRLGRVEKIVYTLVATVTASTQWKHIMDFFGGA